MRLSKLTLVALIAFIGVANAAGKPDTYSCPKSAGPNGQLVRASTIALYSGHPSELGMLKPENADTDDTGPAFWAMGPSEYDYWYVCAYNGAVFTHEFKLAKKVYSRCSNIGSGKFLDKLKCR